MTPGPTNADMFSGKAQAEEALERNEDVLEKSQQENGALRDALEDIENRCNKLAANALGEIAALQTVIADLRAKFADL